MARQDEPIFTMRMPQELKEQFTKVTKSQDITPSQVVRKLVREWLEKQPQQGR